MHACLLQKNKKQKPKPLVYEIQLLPENHSHNLPHSAVLLTLCKFALEMYGGNVFIFERQCDSFSVFSPRCSGRKDCKIMFVPRATPFPLRCTRLSTVLPPLAASFEWNIGTASVAEDISPQVLLMIQDERGAFGWDYFHSLTDAPHVRRMQTDLVWWIKMRGQAGTVLRFSYHYIGHIVTQFAQSWFSYIALLERQVEWSQ